MTHSHDVGRFFDAEWNTYREIVANNALWHDDMFAMLKTCLQQAYADKPFTLVDLGCGDGSAIVESLVNSPIQRYIGVDAAAETLQKADDILAKLTCDKQFLCGDMLEILTQLTTPVEIIFSSYALHHLSYQQKEEFLKQCQQKLIPGGYLCLVDGILARDETREHWIERLQQRILTAVPDLPISILNTTMEHPKTSDFPETLATYQQFAEQQAWFKFEVLVNKQDFCAFMLWQKAPLSLS
ncbi:MAG: class I SAM-dependent methyltransferase [Legionellales bacterium]|nr:class I SAM-dependent methyltransferase [Legionellales bacterium]